jgi:hypothetical protein
MLSHINPIHSIPSYLSNIHFNIVHPVNKVKITCTSVKERGISCTGVFSWSWNTRCEILFCCMGNTLHNAAHRNDLQKSYCCQLTELMNFDHTVTWRMQGVLDWTTGFIGTSVTVTISYDSLNPWFSKTRSIPYCSKSVSSAWLNWFWSMNWSLLQLSLPVGYSTAEYSTSESSYDWIVPLCNTPYIALRVSMENVCCFRWHGKRVPYHVSLHESSSP